jgi:hypothetical protein
MENSESGDDVGASFMADGGSYIVPGDADGK